MTVDLLAPSRGVGSEVTSEGRARAVPALAALCLVVAAGGSLAALFVAAPPDMAAEAARSTVVLCFASAGALAFSRRPGERQGLLVLWAAALGATATLAASVLGHYGGPGHNVSSVVELCRLIEPVAIALLPIAVMHLLLSLPDGSCTWSRGAILGGYAVGLAVGLGVWTRRPDLVWWPIVAEASMAILVGIIGSQRRYARSTGLERRRMQWFGWAVAVGLDVALVSLALRVLWGWPTRVALVAGLACLPLASAVALGSTRRFANRIDRLLAHTVSVTGLTAVVLAVYLLIVVGLGRIPTRGERSLLALSMLAASIAALLYAPARARLAEYANRIVYGEREAPDAVLRAFGSRLTRAIAMDELLLQVAESLRKTLDLATAEVWTGSAGRLERTVSVPDVPVARLALSPEEEAVVARSGVTGTAWAEIWLPALLAGREHSVVRIAPTTHSGHVLGLVVAVRRPGSDPFTEDDDSMLTELARQLALALHNVELDSALQESLDEVRRQAEQLQESRARIVAASDAARRQIERNLHDGAQQHLVALAVNVRLAHKMMEKDPASASEVLDQLGEGLQEAVQELRALAHGIYPPLLVDRGIDEALRSAAGRAALPTDVEATGLRRYSAEEEAAVYFCCTEALQNSGKHAGEGATAKVRVWVEAGMLRFEVSDDGEGFETNGPRGLGAGFVNMADRVGAIGGTIEVHSALGTGTTVSGRIPVND
jgi:signal transduction histidine kinase